MARGCRELIIDAGMRDVADLDQMALPASPKKISVQDKVKETLGDANALILCAGQTIPPGDIICADADAVLQNAQAGLATEEAKRKRLSAGELGLAIYACDQGSPKEV